MSHYKRGRGLGDLGGNTYDQTISSGLITRTRDSIHYDTNILVTTDVDSGLTTNGQHGRYARFRDTRLTPLLGSTGDYTVSLVRGTVTTNDIPLFCPKPSKLITENGVDQWEVSAEPGLSYTWTGPVYTTEANSSILPAFDLTLAAWPASGIIPFYTNTTLPAVGNPARVSGFIDCSTVGSSTDATAATVASRLSTLFSNAGLSILTVTVPAVGAGTTTQYYSLVNSSTSQTVYLDFTLPASYARQNGQTASNYMNTTHPSKQGILEACKFLGFVPNTIFSIPPGASPVTVVAPRAYQLGFRTTMNLYVYKTVRWVPEEQNVSAIVPTAQEVKNGTNGQTPAYFDCYSYQHFLNECINPTFQRLIYDPFDNDGTIPLGEQCLQRQIQTACAANCNTGFWSSNISYNVGDSVMYNGRAYYAEYANIGQTPVYDSTVWMDCGTSIVSSYVPGQTYYNGDVVTFATSSSTYPSINTQIPGTNFGTGSDTIVKIVSGSNTLTVSATATNVTVLVVLVGGGGGGGNNFGGGGGGGGVVVKSMDLKPGVSYPFVVGTQGNAGVNGGNGGNTTFNGVTAFGGGGGSSNNFGTGSSGGSGGGSEGIGVVGQGSNGGDGTIDTAGGGGGAGPNAPSNSINGREGLRINTGDSYFIVGSGGGGGSSGSMAGKGGSLKVLPNSSTISFAGNGGTAGVAGSAAAGGYGGGGGGGGSGASGGSGRPGAIYFILRASPIPILYSANTTTTNLPTSGDWTNISSGLISATTTIQTTPNLPAVATAAPFITLNPSTQLFVMNLDSYGFGGTDSTNVDDGYGGFIEDSVNDQSAAQQDLNSALNDQARDSWGLTGTAPITTQPYTVARHPFRSYDERLNIEVDDYFHQLFGNWPASRLLYTDPRTQVTTAYVRYVPQAITAGLSVLTPLPYATPTVASTSYLPYGRVAGNTPYFYTYPQDYPSVGLMWNPVDTLVVVTGEIPLLNDEVSPTYFLGDVYTTNSNSSNGDSLKILGEFVVKAINQVGQEYRSEIVFEPQSFVRCSLQAGVVFKTFDYQIMMRMKNSNGLRALSLSNGGSVFMRFEFQIKEGI